MSAFNLKNELQNGGFPSEMKMYETSEGFMHGWGATDPVAGDDYAPGATFQNVTNKKLLVNTGTKASPTWTDQA